MRPVEEIGCVPGRLGRNVLFLVQQDSFHKLFDLVAHKAPDRNPKIARDAYPPLFERGDERLVDVVEGSLQFRVSAKRRPANLDGQGRPQVPENVFEAEKSSPELLIEDPKHFHRILLFNTSLQGFEYFEIFLVTGVRLDRAAEIETAEMDHHVDEVPIGKSPLVPYGDMPVQRRNGVGAKVLFLLRYDFVGIQPELPAGGKRKRLNRIVGRHPVFRNDFRLYFLQVHPGAVFQLWHVGRGFFKDPEESLLQRLRPRILRQLHGSGGIFEEEQRFELADFIEKPAARRKHEKRKALHLEQFQEPGLVAGGRAADQVLFQKAFQAGVLVQNDIDVFVSGLPGIIAKLAHLGFIMDGERIPQEIESPAKRRPPFLVPAGLGPDPAPAVLAPPPKPVCAAPRRVLENLHLRHYREGGQEVPIIGYNSRGVVLQLLKSGRKGHIAEFEMVSVRLSVRRRIHKPRLFSRFVPKPIGPVDLRQEFAAVLEHPLKSNPAGKCRVIEKDVNDLPAAAVIPVSPSRRDNPAAGVLPLPVAAQKTPFRGLVRRKYGELDAGIRQDRQGGTVHRSFGKPHAFRTPAEAIGEIANSPEHLCHLVALIRKGHNDMVVYLGDRISMAVANFETVPVRIQYGPVDPWMLPLDPPHQRRTEIKTEVQVVVPQAQDTIVVGRKPGRGIGPVALYVDAFVPVMVRTGRILTLDFLEPWIFPGGLVEMTVDTNVFCL